LRLSYQGNDPLTGGAITYQDGSTNKIWSSIASNAADSNSAHLIKIWEYGTPQKVNFYKIQSFTVTNGSGGGLYAKDVEYIGGANVTNFTNPIVGWSQNGNRGATADSRLLFSGTRSYSGFTPTYTGLSIEFDFGLDMGGLGSPVNGQPVSTAFKSSSSGQSQAIMRTPTGTIDTTSISAGFRINQTYGTGDKIIIRGVVFFNKRNLGGTVTNQAEMKTAMSYIDLPSGEWDPSTSSQTLIPFAGTNSTKTHTVQTGTNGSTCVFEHEMVCNSPTAMVVGDLLYFGWTVTDLSGESSTAKGSSCTFQIYRD